MSGTYINKDDVGLMGFDLPCQNFVKADGLLARRGTQHSRTISDLILINESRSHDPGNASDLQQGDRIDTCAFKICLLKDGDS